MAAKMSTPADTSTVSVSNNIEDHYLTEARADVMTEFLEIAIHSILYVRGVYPSGIFKPRRKYNITVQMSCHVELNEYIKRILSTVHSLLLQNALEKVEVAIMNSDSVIMESFLFTFDLPQSLHGKSKEMRRDTFLLELEESLRGALLKISISDALVKPHLPNSKFNIFIHTNNSAAANLQHQHLVEEFPWLRTTPQERGDTSGQLPSCIAPLKSISTELIKMEIHVASKKDSLSVTAATEQK